MDNHARRVNYVAAKHRDLPREMVHALVTGLYLAGHEDLMNLTPAQRRRIRHKRGQSHAPTPRGPAPHTVIYDEVPGEFAFEAAAMQTSPRMTGRAKMAESVKRQLTALMSARVRKAVG